MNQDRLFERTRWRLASWYALVMGAILGVCGLGVYEAIAHAHRVTIDRELASIAGTLHDSLEPFLEQPGQFTPAATRLLPDVCLAATECPQRDKTPAYLSGTLEQRSYYMLFFNPSERLVAVVGRQPETLPVTNGDERWQTFTDAEGTPYRQMTLLLHTQDEQDWGYLQVGRNVQDFADYVATVKWILLVGLPAVMLLVAAASWWLAGLAMQPIYQSYRQIQQFTADAAHELRTPLAAIQATVESALMLPEQTEAEARDILKTTKRQTQRLSQLVADLLMLCRMDRQSHPSLATERLVLQDLVNDITEELSALALTTEVVLSSEIRVPEPLEVTGDVEQLYRLVSNLVVNAIHHTPAGGQVTLILNRAPGFALVHVRDTGMGIAPEEQGRIFDRFYRVSGNRSRTKGGSGLGLSIARAIALAHHGSISVQSELGKGSTFTLRLPRNY